VTFSDYLGDLVAQCFGGNLCNRCIKRKYACEFTAFRHRGPNKPRRNELSPFDDRDQVDNHRHSVSHAHAHAVALPYHPANPAHAHSQEQSLLLARARPHTKSRARRLLYPLGQLWFGRARPVAAQATADARRLAPLDWPRPRTHPPGGRGRGG
jgi:hypothetical protein